MGHSYTWGSKVICGSELDMQIRHVVQKSHEQVKVARAGQSHMWFIVTITHVDQNYTCGSRSHLAMWINLSNTHADQS